MTSGANGLFFYIDDDHTLVFEKFVRGIDLKRFFARPWRRAAQQSWEGEYLFKDRRRVMAVADPSRATTIPIPVEFVREPSDVKLPITVPELENRIAQETAKIFNRCRAEAAARLGVHELDTVLVGEKARAFKVDGAPAANPAGLAGKKVTLLLELTFTGRELFETLKPFFNAPEDFYFAESPQSRLSSLAKVGKVPLAIIAPGDAPNAGDGKDAGAGEEMRGGHAAPHSSLFILQSAHGRHAYPVLYREPFSWEFERVFGRIEHAFGVGPGVARELYAAYCGGGFSESGGRAFKKVIEPAFEELYAEMAKKKLKGAVYVDAPYGLPFALPHREGEAVFESMPLGEALALAGFAEGMQAHGGKKGAVPHANALSHHLLPFIEAYFDRSGTDLNRKLRRRLHWLAS